MCEIIILHNENRETNHPNYAIVFIKDESFTTKPSHEGNTYKISYCRKSPYSKHKRDFQNFKNREPYLVGHKMSTHIMHSPKDPCYAGTGLFRDQVTRSKKPMFLEETQKKKKMPWVLQLTKQEISKRLTKQKSQQACIHHQRLWLGIYNNDVV